MADLMGDFHDGDVVLSRSPGAQMVVHHDGDPWLVHHYELVTCPHGLVAADDIANGTSESGVHTPMGVHR